jgi:hypothetical protein
MNRIVCWFSCGAASAVATKLAIADNAGLNELAIVYTGVINEHPDNKRFLRDCEAWFGQKIIILQNDTYNGDIYEVFRKEKFLVSQFGAPCTRLLKRQMRVMFEEEDDYQVFGFTVEEAQRAKDFQARNSYVKNLTPLIDRGLSKADCLAMIERAGIAIPAMYLLGYKNNNCIGCVKGGMGYWNKIRVDFPIQFAEMALLERELGHSVNKDDSGPVYLDEMDASRGVNVEQPDIECSFFCNMAEQEYK